jgi:hypothetical protein
MLSVPLLLPPHPAGPTMMTTMDSAYSAEGDQQDRGKAITEIGAL